MSKLLMNLAVAGVFASAWPMTAGAQQNDRQAAAAAREIAGAIDATTAVGNARIAALVSSNGLIIRSKGIASITVPAVGQICIKPQSAAINLNSIVPVATVDWSNSIGVDNVVQYRSSGLGCPAGQISVLTYRRASPSAAYLASSAVAFTIVIP